MKDAIKELYENHSYPAMSHPITDPAVTGVAARMGGLTTPHPARARILEIGCSSGHNLIPLAMRWPDSQCIGIDLAATSIHLATARAAEAGVTNVSFEAVDLQNFDARGGIFDYIIAHGFLSWVPDHVKAALLIFCRNHLSPTGIATVSYNVECGWQPRFNVIQKVRAIQAAKNTGLVESLEILRYVTDPDSSEIAMIDDMLAKGEGILPFDDFGPSNDAWSLDQFVGAAMNAGLRWIGESDPGENIPSELNDEVVDELANQFPDKAAFFLAVDKAAKRTFRSGVLCRDDALLDDRIRLDLVSGLSISQGLSPSEGNVLDVWQHLRSLAPASVPVSELALKFQGISKRQMDALVFGGIGRKWFLPRMEPVNFGHQPPAFPKLNPFRRLCIREDLFLVDARHQSCRFPESQRQILARMDGTQSLDELATYAEFHSPKLAFVPWIRHLTSCGMFA